VQMITRSKSEASSFDEGSSRKKFVIAHRTLPKPPLDNRETDGSAETSGNQDQNGEIDSDYESDAVYLSDSNEENPNFGDVAYLHQQNYQPTRGEKLSRTRRVTNPVTTNKLLVTPITIKTKDIDNNNIVLARYAEAIQCHFPPSQNQRFCVKKNSDDNYTIICPTCSREVCHSYCPIQATMKEVRSTIQWMEQIHWKPSSNEKPFSFDWKDIPENEKQQRVERLKALPQDEKFSSLDLLNGQTNILDILDKQANILLYLTSKLRITEVRHTRFQRAVYRLLMIHFNETTEDDARLALKFARVLLCLQDPEKEVEDIWQKARTEGSLNGIDSLEKLCNYARAIFEYKQMINENNENQHDKSFDESTLPIESKNDDWGINLQYVECGVAEPRADPLKVAMFCIVPSRQPPASIIKQLLRSLRKEFNFLVQECPSSIDPSSSKVQTTFIAKDPEHEDTELIFRADNWNECDLHLFIRISSSTPHKVEEILISELKKHFRGASTQENIDEHVSILPYNQIITTTGENNSLQLVVTTGEDSDSYFPSTSIIGSRNGQVIVRCLLTWCNNLETLTNGPTIQYITVKKDHRNKGIGTLVLQWLIEHFLSEVYMPKAREISVYATNVCSAHSFFIKNGFKFLDFYQEEAKKDFTRPSKPLEVKENDSQVDTEESKPQDEQEQSTK